MNYEEHPKSTIILSIENLTKTYAGRTVVDNVNLSLGKGEIFALMGPNGSGKSTLVKMLSGIIRPTTGDALILNRSIVRDPDEIKKSIGVLPETLGLFDSLTIREHLILSGNVYGISKTDTAFRAEQLLKYLDLWPTRNTKIELASFGMKKKCALAMAVLHAPALVFLDEPFEGIDPLSARNIKNICRRLAKRGTTVFITSHTIDIMEKLADSFAIISGGSIRCRLDAGELLRQEMSLENAYYKFIGDTSSGDLSWLEN